MIQYTKNNRFIVTLTLDMAGRSVNIINHEVASVFAPVLDKLEADAAKKELRGVIITSAKRSFLAGGDLDYLHSTDDAEDISNHTKILCSIFRRIELLKVPVVAAINGAALGSGFELALACHYRIALDHPKTIIGLPEVTLGMIPVGGGINRLTWMLGMEKAFAILTRGKSFHLQEAKNKGLIDEIAYGKTELFSLAEKWILSNPDITKPWDKPTIFALHQHNDPKTSNIISRMNAKIIRKTRNNYPAVQAIFNTMVEGSFVDFDTATRIGGRYFTSLILSKSCLNLTKAFWYDLNRIKNGASRPRGFGRFRARQIGIIGAGKMGSGIAYMCAIEGIEVVLKDIAVSIAQQGKEYSKKMLHKLVSSNKMTQQQCDDVLAKIHPTDKMEDLEDCDLIIESVFENINLKHRIIRETELYMHKQAFLASNTSTIRINDLATASVHPDNFIGLHFFSPVSVNPLVEVIYGPKTSDETLARAFDFVRQMQKIPIIVKDNQGFYTARAVRSYIIEGLRMIHEGQNPITIERAALKAGMKKGPLTLADEFSLKGALYVERQMDESVASKEALEVLALLVDEHKRFGKGRKQGFYDYIGKSKHIWADLQEYFPHNKKQLTEDEMIERLLFVQCIEAAKALQEGVIVSNADANLGSIHGWGFSPFSGGAIQYINDYGVPEFVARAGKLEKKYGERFKIPESIMEMAQQQANFS